MHFDPSDWLGLLPGVVKVRKGDAGEGGMNIRINAYDLGKSLVNAAIIALVAFLTIQHNQETQGQRIDELIKRFDAFATEQKSRVDSVDARVNGHTEELARRSAAYEWAQRKMQNGGK